MRKLFLFFFIFSIFLKTSAQSYEKASITLPDGTTIEGTGKFKGKLIFKRGKEAKKEIPDQETITQFTITTNKGKETYQYLSPWIRPNGKKELFQLLEKGKINLYKKKETTAMYTGNGMMGRGFTQISNSVYYYSKKGDNRLTTVPHENPASKKFRAEAKFIFTDCPDLLAKIDSGYFTRDGLQQVFAYYNNNLNCPE